MGMEYEYSGYGCFMWQMRGDGATAIFNTCQIFYLFFFFQAEDGIRDVAVTGVQTCALSDLRSFENKVKRKSRPQNFDNSSKSQLKL